MKYLNKEIERIKNQLSVSDWVLVDELIKSSRFPFNKYADIFSILLSKGILTYEQYNNLRDAYLKRNPNLDKFEMAPRTFGQTWGENWLKDVKKGILLDPPIHDGCSNQFDLWLPTENNKGIKIEVKSSHVADKDSKLTLIEKALKKPQGTEDEIFDEIKKLNFEMNFQQLKPSCCDVFIWIAVWLDDIDLWVIPSSKIVMRPKNTPRRKPHDSIVSPNGELYMGIQHQGGKGGKVPEGQIFVTNNHYKDLQQYKVSLETLIEKIKKQYNMETLIKNLNIYKKRLSIEEQTQLSDSVLDKLYTVYPFNKIEYTISLLIAKNIISLDEYQDMRAEYLQRNKYLHLFELAPRTFGETWGQNHLMELVPEFMIPTKRLDPMFCGEYDLLLNNIHVEVKASRAVKKKGGDTLANKALASNSASKFDMNFQQLKPSCCDVFIWIAVWRDKIDYWVMSSDDVQNNPLLSNQHRASQLSDSGEVVEGQIHINNGNYADFEKYRVQVREIYDKVIEIGKRR